MDLEIIILTQKNIIIICIIFHLHVESKNSVSELIYKTEVDSHT